MRASFGIVVLAATAWALASCERDDIVSVDPADAPGESAPTVEALLSPALVDGWTDTAFAGFASATSAGFIQVEEGSPGLASRGLMRFGFIDDSVFFADTISLIVRYDSAQVVLNLDTTRTAIAAGGTTVQLRALDQDWDPSSATWEFAVDSIGASVPWSPAPGGALGAVLGEAVATGEADTLVFELGAISDSLVKSWADTTQVNTGLAVVVADSGRLVVQLNRLGSVFPTPRLRYHAVPELQPDTAIELTVFATSRTFIFDRSAQTVPAGVLRVGGVEGWRAFAEVRIPDSVTVEGLADKVRLRGSTINRAELVLSSLAPPAAPFGAEDAFVAVAFELIDDFRDFGPKTPVGSLILNSDVTIEPDSLAAGSTLSMNLTGFIQDWAGTPPDSTAPAIRIALRAFPEASTFGFWEFGAVDGDPALTPVLRIIFTPKTEFSLP